MSVIQKIKNISHNTTAEAKKCTWPNREELVQSTKVVIVALGILVAFVAVVDIACKSILGKLVG